MQRREFIAGTATVAGLGALGGAMLPGAAAAAAPGAVVSGPISGGRRGWPLASYPTDLGRFGYVEQEFFFAGRATAYRPLVDLKRQDGEWSVEPTGARPYKTRLLVHRPRDPAKFNGTVLVEWINVSPGYDNLIVPDDAIYDGFAYVGVSAQYVGVHGFPAVPAAERHGLTQWDPVRYGSLAHPGDAYSFDIYTQAARLLRSPGSGVNPLAGLTVRKLIGTGASQSAGRLRAYINAIHPRDRAYDAYVPFLDFANANDFANGLMTPASTEAERARRRHPVRYRDDLDVPVMVVNTEQEAISYRGDRLYLLQPDSDRFRLWEVAGAPHSADIASDPVTRSVTSKRDGLRRSAIDEPGAQAGSRVSSWDTTVAAYHHVHSWISGGPPPPHQPLLRFTEAPKPELIRDSLGIGTGGIRLPETDVPIEMNTGLSNNPRMRRNRGISEPFTAEQLRQLYPTKEDYVRKVIASAEAALSAGVIRPYRVQEYIAQARAAPIPPA